MSKAGAKAAARKAREEVMEREYPPYGGRNMLKALGELGFHRLRRLYSVHRAEGEVDTFNTGLFRYLWYEFCPDMVGRTTSWEECEEMLRTLEGVLVPGSPATAALDAHIMELGRKGGCDG